METNAAMPNEDPSNSEGATEGPETGKFDAFYQVKTDAHDGMPRRTMVAIAALTALLAGTVFAYSAFSNGESNDATPIDDLALTWTEYNPWASSDPFEGYSIGTVGDGRVFARAFARSEYAILISENGEDWKPVAVPVAPRVLDISGDRWLVVGPEFNRFPAVNRAFYSDSKGHDWTELNFGGEITDDSSIVLALVSGRNMVVGFETTDDSESSSESPQTDTQLLVYTSDGETATITGSYPSIYTTASSDTDGFYIVVSSSADQSLLTSADGFSWAESSIIDTFFPEPGTIGLRSLSNSDTWFLEGYIDETRVKSLDQLGDPESTIATIRPVGHLFSFDVGPAGMVAMAMSDSSPEELILGWSTDGIDWEWRDPAVDLGVDGGNAVMGFSVEDHRLGAPAVEFAVGTDFVLAKVTEFAVPLDRNNPQVRSTRWLKATVE